MANGWTMPACSRESQICDWTPRSRKVGALVVSGVVSLVSVLSLS
jgi:hypothetical protein